MANVSLKTDFKDGDKLFAQQLNNNFSAIKAALSTMNKIVWQDDPDDSVTTFRGTTEEINARDIIDGQLLYDTTTGETYIDYGSQRISTGSGNAIFIGDTEPTNPSTQLWIEPNTPLQAIGTEVINSMQGDEINKSPSVHSVKDYINEVTEDVYSTTEVKTNKVWIDDKPIYRKVIVLNNFALADNTTYNHGIQNIDNTTDIKAHMRDNAVITKYPLVSHSGKVMNVYFNPSELLWAGDDTWTAQQNRKHILILEYTKTTDEVEGGAN